MVPRINELIKMAEILNEHSEEFDLSQCEIVFKVDRQLLDRLNEDFFYRNGNTGTSPEPTDEICVNVSGITFKYIID